MKLTLEEIERKVYMAGDKKLADFIGLILDTDFNKNTPFEDCFFIEDELFEDFHAA